MSSQSYNTSQQFAGLDYKSGAHLWFSDLDTNSPWGTSFQLPVISAKKEVGLDSKLSNPKQLFSNDFVDVSANQRWNTQSIAFGSVQAEAANRKANKVPAVAAVDVAAGCDSALEEEISQNLYKTELCRSFEETGNCRYGLKCQFAHGRSELRYVTRHPKYKTEVCKTFHTIGTCPYGKRCRFIHIEAPVSPPNGPVKQTSPIKSEIKTAVKTPLFENTVTNTSLVSKGWSSNWNGAFPLTTTVNFNPVVNGLTPKIPTAVQAPSNNSTLDTQERGRLGFFQQFCS